MVIRLSKFINSPISLKVNTNTYFSVEILKINVSSYMEGDGKGGTRMWPEGYLNF